MKGFFFFFFTFSKGITYSFALAETMNKMKTSFPILCSQYTLPLMEILKILRTCLALAFSKLVVTSLC